jgi:hypothetical protein
MRGLYPAISMIYRDSNVALDAFKNSGYVTHRIEVFGRNWSNLAVWNWLKQEKKALLLHLDVKEKAPGSLRGLLFSQARY